MAEAQIIPELKKQVTVEQAWHYGIVPFKNEEGTLHVLVSESNASSDLKTELEIILGKTIFLQKEEPKELEKLLLLNYPKVGGKDQSQHPSSNHRLNVQDNNFLETLVKEAK